MQPREFYNKNCFRNYPVRGGCSRVSVDGRTLPTDILVGARLVSSSTVVQYASPWISRLVIQDDTVTVAVSAYAHEPTVYWYGQARVSEDYTVIPMQFNTERLTSLPDGVDYLNRVGGGFLVVGSRASVLANQGSFVFNQADTQLEDSTSVYLPPPLVHSLGVQDQPVQGVVRLELDNMISTSRATAAGHDWMLRVLNSASVASRRDRASIQLTCDNHVIASINGVRPDSNGNIDIFGIEPVKIRVSGFGILIDTVGVGLASVCAPDNVPPYLENNDYIGSILGVAQPEWKTYWEQYQT